MIKEKRMLCLKCVYWDRVEFCCENPNVIAEKQDLGIGYNFKNETCKSFLKADTKTINANIKQYNKRSVKQNE